MLLSGFTFIRNAVKYDFPITECVASMLPLVDELVINVGKSDDATEELIAKIDSPKIRLVRSVWDDSKTDRGLVLSEQTNIALDACRGKWAIYLQADEALHEAEHVAIRKAVEEADASSGPIEGLRFRYLHFYGGYTLVQRPWNWYPSEIRVVRCGANVRSYGDAQTFRIMAGGSERELDTRLIDAHVFHYGHARAPEVMERKIRYFHRFWHGDNHGIDVKTAYKLDWKSLVWYWGSHPAPYAARVTEGLKWSPKPSTSIPGAPFREVVVLAGAAETALAQELEALIEKHAPAVQVTIVASTADLPLAHSDAAFVDLCAESHSAFKFLRGSLTWLRKFGWSVAHSPSGTLSSRRASHYSAVSWGRHETADQGFIVPEREYARQLARWVGVDL